MGLFGGEKSRAEFWSQSIPGSGCWCLSFQALSFPVSLYSPCVFNFSLQIHTMMRTLALWALLMPLSTAKKKKRNNLYQEQLSQKVKKHSHITTLHQPGNYLCFKDSEHSKQYLGHRYYSYTSTWAPSGHVMTDYYEFNQFCQLQILLLCLALPQIKSFWC